MMKRLLLPVLLMCATVFAPAHAQNDTCLLDDHFSGDTQEELQTQFRENLTEAGKIVVRGDQTWVDFQTVTLALQAAAQDSQLIVPGHLAILSNEQLRAAFDERYFNRVVELNGLSRDVRGKIWIRWGKMIAAFNKQGCIKVPAVNEVTSIVTDLQSELGATRTNAVMTGSPQSLRPADQGQVAATSVQQPATATVTEVQTPADNLPPEVLTQLCATEAIVCKDELADAITTDQTKALVADQLAAQALVTQSDLAAANYLTEEDLTPFITRTGAIAAFVVKPDPTDPGAQLATVEDVASFIDQSETAASARFVAKPDPSNPDATLVTVGDMKKALAPFLTKVAANETFVDKTTAAERNQQVDKSLGDLAFLVKVALGAILLIALIAGLGAIVRMFKGRNSRVVEQPPVAAQTAAPVLPAIQPERQFPSRPELEAVSDTPTATEESLIDDIPDDDGLFEADAVSPEANEASTTDDRSMEEIMDSIRKIVGERSDSDESAIVKEPSDDASGNNTDSTISDGSIPL